MVWFGSKQVRFGSTWVGCGSVWVGSLGSRLDFDSCQNIKPDDVAASLVVESVAHGVCTLNYALRDYVQL